MPAIAFRLMSAIPFRRMPAIAKILMPEILIQWRGENSRYRQNP